MHYTGTIWRPPYEAGSLLIQVTAGCTHHRCKFCTLYDDLPFRFRMSPMSEVEANLLEAQTELRGIEEARLKLGGLANRPRVERVFLVGANPFALDFGKLKKIGGLVRRYFPECRSIGCFARVTDVARKTDAELKELARMGYNGISIGAETGDDEALAFMDKGYAARDIIDQAGRLDEAGIRYCFMYLAGISGAGRGEEGAEKSAAVFNRTRPQLIGSSMLTVWPGSRLYREVQAGNWREEPELEKLRELRALVAGLEIPTHFATLGASNAVWAEGELPREKGKVLAALEEVLARQDEGSLRLYRETLPHL